jgi:hypothetical protein
VTHSRGLRESAAMWRVPCRREQPRMVAVPMALKLCEPSLWMHLFMRCTVQWREVLCAAVWAATAQWEVAQGGRKGRAARHTALLHGLGINSSYRPRPTGPSRRKIVASERTTQAIRRPSVGERHLSIGVTYGNSTHWPGQLSVGDAAAAPDPSSLI